MYSELEFYKMIFNLQKHIIFAIKNNRVISANQSFLDFFHIKDIVEFNKAHTNISDLFMEHDNYFTAKDTINKQTWTEFLSTHQDSHFNILLMDTDNFSPKAFKINVHNMNMEDIYLVTLTDITQMTIQTKQFENKATYDALTKVFNRAKFNEILSLKIQTSQVDKTPISFAIFDIDFFKKVNDTYGHIVGDTTLITFAQTIQKHIRLTDTFARWGGEEFVLALPGLDVKSAFYVVDNLRKTIEETTFSTIGNITCSVGLTQYKNNDNITDILTQADEALYEAKESGRNKVCVK